MRQQHFFPSFKSDGDLDNIRGEEKGRKIKKGGTVRWRIHFKSAY